MLTHVIGDSHALTFGGAHNIQRHWLGPTTAFQLYKKHKDIMEIINALEETIPVWFILGEIDCRIQIYQKSIELDLPIDFLIENTVNQYINYIDFLRYNITNPITVLTIIPQGYSDNTWGVDVFADRETRVSITKEFNKKLQNRCKLHNISLLNLWPEDLTLEDYDYDSPGKSPKAHLRTK
jgi:hypothetical protein